MAAAFIATAIAQEDATAARAQWRGVADQLRPKLPKLAAFMDQAEAYVIGIFPNDEAAIRVVGAILLKQSDEWSMQRGGYMTLETIAALADNPVVSAARSANFNRDRGIPEQGAAARSIKGMVRAVILMHFWQSERCFRHPAR